MNKLQRKLFFKLFLSGTLIAWLTACSSGHYRAPVVEIGEDQAVSQRTTVVLADGPKHRVNEGESLYTIAWMYDMDYIALALANNIQAPYVIYPGQELSLDVSGNRSTSLSTVNNRQAPLQNSSNSDDRSNATNAQSRGTGERNTLLRWVWPAQGELITAFSTNDNKGIDIAGNTGDPVLAAEGGEVVYAGNGLLRYGELVIIKHNDQFLSAYAHNSVINVAEGETVNRGQQIANLGSTGVDSERLHFEIRLSGQPVNPTNYLPPR